MNRLVSPAAYAALAFLALGVNAHAGLVVTYGFENLSDGQATPILNAPPDSGDPSFLADFTSVPDAGAFSVFSFISGLQPAFSGNFFSSQIGSTSTLTLTFNQLVDGLSLDFSLNVSNSNPAAGSFQAATPFQTFSVASADIGGSFQGGSLSFAGATPFTTVQLTAFDTAGNPIAFTIDNLVITGTIAAVPEPSTLAMGGAAVLIGLGCAWRRRRTLAA